jgi:hypothetical protein
MRGSLTGSLSRLAIVALVTSSFAVPALLDASPAMARAAGGSAAGAAGASGATGGSTGGSTGGGGVTPLSVITSLDSVRDPPRRRLRAQLPHDGGDSCYQSQPMFDRWGDYVGKQQLPDFCY